NCQKEKEAEEFVCPEGTQGNGNFADPATCRRFYQVSARPIN
ncbi:jg21353, partial [Pararge aegeria aegeria]